MKGSGKQVLLKILSELSTRAFDEEELPVATKRLRAGLLLHGSTSEESYDHARNVSWASCRDSSGELKHQGIAVGASKTTLSELYETLFSVPGIEENLLQAHPGLGPQGVATFEWIMWLLVSAVQMFPELAEIEVAEELGVDEWVESMARHYDNHFKDDGDSDE